MKKQKLGQLLLALSLVFLLAAGCTLKKEIKTEENEDQETIIDEEDIDENEIDEEMVEEMVEEMDSEDEEGIDFEEEAIDDEEEENKEETKNNTDNIEEMEWKLVSGDPSDTCSSPTYSGEAKLNGWYVFDYSYVEKEWLLQVAEEDAKKIPVEEVYGEKSYGEWIKKPQFLLGGVTPELENELKNASPENPIEVTVKGFKAYCEGAPQLSISGSF